MALCQKLLDLYTSDEEKFCRLLFTGIETWIHHWDPESILESVQWKHVESPIHKNLDFSHQPVKLQRQFFGILEDYFS